MTKLEIREKLKEIFKLVIHNGINVDLIEDDANIKTDLNVNSIGLIYLLIAIEKTFNLDMSDVTFNTFSKVGEVIDYIYEKQN